MPTPPNANREREGVEQEAFYWPLAPGWQDTLPRIPEPTRLKIAKRVNSIVIRRRSVVKWRSLVTVVGGSLGIIVAAWLIAHFLQGPHPEAERWNFQVQVVALLVSMIPGLLVFLYLLFSFAISEHLVIDEHGLQIQEMGHGVFVSNSQLLATRPVCGSSRCPRLNALTSRWRPLSLAEAGYLDIVTPNGVLRLLDKWRMEDIRWLSTTLALMWIVPEEDELDIKKKRSDYGHDGRTVLITERLNRPTRLGLTWLLLIIALLFSLIFCWHMPSGLASCKWPKTEGLVNRAELNVTGSGLNRNSDVKIEYTYDVGGKSYHGDRLWFAHRSNTWELEDMATSHPPGSSIDVYYDPADQSRAVLLPGVPFDSYMPFLFVTPLLLLAGLILRYMRLSPEQERLQRMFVRSNQQPRRRRTHNKTARASRS